MSSDDPFDIFFELQAKNLLVDPQDGKLLASSISTVFIQPEGKEDEKDATHRIEDLKETIRGFQFLFKYWVDTHPNDLAIKLSKIMRSCSEMPIVRSLSIFLLYALFHNTPHLKLSPETLSQLKHDVLSSLQDLLSTSLFPVMSGVISMTAYNVFELKGGDGEWTDYFDYVVSMTDDPSEYQKGLWLVLDLPLNTPRQTFTRYAHKIQNKILNYLDSNDGDIWAVAFSACFTTIIILVEGDIAEKVLNALKKSVTELMNEGKQVVVRKGIKILVFFVTNRVWLSYTRAFELVKDVIIHIADFECIDMETALALKRLTEECIR